MATIREVAKAANVSITTVSKILSKDPDFRASQETRERVLKTAEELHYQYQEKKVSSTSAASCLLLIVTPILISMIFWEGFNLTAHLTMRLFP